MQRIKDLLLHAQISVKTENVVISSCCLANAAIKSKLQHPPRANPGHLTIFCAQGVGNLICKAFRGGGGGFELCLGVVGNIEPEVSVFWEGAEVANVFRRDGIN